MHISYQIRFWLSLMRDLWRRNAHLNLNQVSASLSFTTILAFVPILTVGSILISYLPAFIDIKNTYQTWLLQTYFPPAISKQMMVYMGQFSSKARGLTVLGLLSLFVVTLITMGVIERAFNEIWHVKVKRPFTKRVFLYLLATILGPLGLGLGIYLSGLLFSAASGLIPSLSDEMRVAATVLPSLLAVLVFALAYRILPYSQVRWGDAFIGAILAALAYELGKFGFAYFVMQAPFHKTVYGTFAILPLMLLWIYLTWWVTLVGALIVANLPAIRARIAQNSVKSSG